MNLGTVKVQNFCYNSRLQITGIRVGSAADSSCQSLSTADVTLGLGYGTGNNGNVKSQSIQLGSTVLGTQAYEYDALNRLKTAVETKGAGGTAWSQTFVYDRYGNRAMLGTSSPSPATGVPQVALDDPGEVTALLATYTDPVSGATVVNNKWLGSTVDAAGNVSTAVAAAYPRNLSYDGENRLVSAQTSGSGTMTAEYDGEGHRVKRTVNGVTTTVYVYDAMGQLAQEYGGEAVTTSGRQYLVADHLGSTRLVLDGNGVVQTRSDYLPFGQEIELGLGDRTVAQGYESKAVADADRQRMRFTGKERDAETGLDYFGARYFSGAQGRFTSPDPKSAGADPQNPQSWNGYSYALNSPFAYVDPNGQWPFFVHNRMYQAFNSDLSPHHQALLGQVSYNQDFGPGAQDPGQSYTHSMCFSGQSAGACVAMINRFIDQNLALANDLSGGGRDLNDDAITAFAKAAHALTDMSSPAHVGADGMPIGWSNGRAAGLAHVYAERNASVDWFRAGQGMRLEIAGYARAFPYLAKKHGNQDAWAQREIEHFVSSYFATEDPAVRNHVAEDAARQCALGNPAACGGQ
ncbi:RHS repeat domain-containing protein [Paludibaculum fermentans]|uniref:RHS repeat-associated core domain-containing protein n=1 Tax=Paludibaculum fermentans TaxID=1473598 RepID=A0A7S7SJU3_PALFE|nr:RHS repeat-associated core domain-containing protein [Paludibaculum fermentans]QOY86796.1 RHS repeat-associated core domain-containing protein [Paludibaculum fermentans]